MDSPKSVCVTVCNIAGVTLLGPKLFPCGMPVSNLRQRLYLATGSVPSISYIALLWNCQELKDSDQLLNKDMLLTMVAKTQLVSEEDAQKYVQDVQQNGQAALQALPAEALSDHALVIKMMNMVCTPHDPSGVFWPILQHMDVKLRANKEVMLHAISQSHYAFSFVDASLQQDPEFLRAALPFLRGWMSAKRMSTFVRKHKSAMKALGPPITTEAMTLALAVVSDPDAANLYALRVLREGPHLLQALTEVYAHEPEWRVEVWRAINKTCLEGMRRREYLKNMKRREHLLDLHRFWHLREKTETVVT